MANTDFKPKFVKWDEDAFRADRIVQRMTPTQRLMYRSLIIEAYYNPQRPFLPDNDEELWLLADADSLEHWLANKAIIMTKFTKVTGSDIPLLQNKRVNEEWADLEKMLADKSKAGAASVAKRRERAAQKPTSVERPYNAR